MTPGMRLPTELAGRDVLVVDVEGNGRQPPEIIELALLPLTTTRPAVADDDLRTWLVRPSRSIAAIVTRKVHGITNADVADAPSWVDIADQVTAQLTGQVLVAHNASVEHRVLGTHLPDWKPPAVLDTMRLAKAVWPQLPGGYGLDRLSDHTGFGAPPALPDATDQRRHRAGYDTWLTAALFLSLLAVLADRDELSWPRLLAVAALPGSAPVPDPDPAEGGLW